MSFRQASYDEPLLFELEEGAGTDYFTPERCLCVPDELRRERLDLPRLSEVQVVRHFTRLSQMNYGVDSGIYPLGSCTMKYNPKVCEDVASDTRFSHLHPLQDEGSVQGLLKIMYELQGMLAEISGMYEVSLQPAAGAHGEFTGMLITQAFHRHNGEVRTEVVLPDTAHGTNPASAAMAGFDVVDLEGRHG